MKNLQQRGVGEQAFEIGRVGLAQWDLHDVGGAVAGRKLHQAEPVAARIEPHGLGVDRDRAAVAREIGQIAAMQADGHCGSPARDRADRGAQERTRTSTAFTAST